MRPQSVGTFLSVFLGQKEHRNNRSVKGEKANAMFSSTVLSSVSPILPRVLPRVSLVSPKVSPWTSLAKRYSNSLAPESWWKSSQSRQESRQESCQSWKESRNGFSARLSPRLFPGINSTLWLFMKTWEWIIKMVRPQDICFYKHCYLLYRQNWQNNI